MSEQVKKAEQRGREVSDLFQEIFDKKKGITSYETLWEFAKRTPEGKRLRVTKELAKDWMQDEGRAQVYKEIAVQWPGRTQRPTQPDRNFDLDGLDFTKSSSTSAEQQGMKHVLLILDRYSR